MIFGWGVASKRQKLFGDVIFVLKLATQFHRAGSSYEKSRSDFIRMLKHFHFTSTNKYPHRNWASNVDHQKKKKHTVRVSDINTVCLHTNTHTQCTFDCVSRRAIHYSKALKEQLPPPWSSKPPHVMLTGQWGAAIFSWNPDSIYEYFP